MCVAPLSLQFGGENVSNLLKLSFQNKRRKELLFPRINVCLLQLILSSMCSSLNFLRSRLVDFIYWVW